MGFCTEDQPRLPRASRGKCEPWNSSRDMTSTLYHEGFGGIDSEDESGSVGVDLTGNFIAVGEKK